MLFLFVRRMSFKNISKELNMKKLMVLTAALLAALFIVGCASKPPAGPTAAELLSSAKGNAPGGTLVGQATSKGNAEQGAINQLARGLTYIAGEMIDEQAAGGRLTAGVAAEFKQKVNLGLTRVAIDAIKVESGAGSDGNYAVYALDKTEALKSLTKAVNAAKEEVAAGNFNLNNFDAAFAKAVMREWKN
jgi:outer membrane murein-binding lipoprotein Lpp